MVLANPISVLKYLLARSTLRCPRSPVAVNRKNPTATSGFANMLGTACPLPCVAFFTFCVPGHVAAAKPTIYDPCGAQVALPCKSQLVGHVRPLTTFAGGPLFTCAIPESCHPPIMWSSQLDARLPIHF